MLILLVSPLVPPGLLSRQAWQALEAGPVLTTDPHHPQFAALLAAGIDVRVTAQAQDGTWLGEPPEPVPAAEHIAVTWDGPGSRLLEAVAVMDRLRSPGGCPWDAEQTHASLRPYVLEEAYEVAQAIDDDIPLLLAEELGDLLLQVLFHARVAADEQTFDVDVVAGLLVDKLVRRHPHVFAGESRNDAADVEAGWDAIKAVEKGGRSVTGGVAVALPSLALVGKLLGRAAKVGLEPADVLVPGEPLTDALLALVIRARAQHQDAEAMLASVARGVLTRLATAEQRLLDGGQDPSRAPVDDWRRALGTTQVVAGPAPAG